ncbi:MAG: MlaD family protein [Bacteroidales bacterium]|nr:MlaD family protein [Bacteroidales bacterium]MDY3912851.1 MlaD family protein [Sodaliphilus sp.]
MKSFFTKNVLIALTVVVSLCLLYWGIEYLKGINLFKPANFYYAKFEKVEGLTVSAPVTVNGFQVGQVREINYDYADNQITVLMSLDKELRVPRGSQVSLSSDILGTAALTLNLAKNGSYYNVGDEIPTAVKAGLMDKVGDDVMPQVVAMLPKVDSILSNVNGVLSNPAINTSVSRLDGITAELARSSQQLTLLMNSLNRSVPGIMGDVKGVTGNLYTASGDIKHLSANVRNMPLDSTIKSLNATVANLQALSAKLNNKESSLGLLLNDKALYNNANSSVMSLDSLLKDVKKNPKRYVTIKVF